MSDRETMRATTSAPILSIGGVLQRKCAWCGQHTVAGGECSECGGKKRTLQRNASSSEAVNAVPPIVHEVLRSPGQPLDANTRAFMEPRFAHDFSRVHVHSDARAAESARAVNAVAYAVGHDLVFGASAYAPQTVSGRWLLAHELAHTVQQAAGQKTRQAKLAIAPAASIYEHEADQAATNVLRGDPVKVGHRFANGDAQPIQRVEHGTYVSTLGDPTYLDAAASFYTSWGHPNVRRASTMDDVLTDLDGRVRGNLDTFRIVSHGNVDGLQFGLMRDISPGGFETPTAEFTNEQRFRQVFSDAVLITDVLFNRLLEILRADATTRPLLTTIGVGAATPANDSALGIMLRAMLETRFLATATQPDGSPVRFPNRNVLEDYNRRRLVGYRRAVINEATQPERTQVGQAIDQLIGETPRALQRAGRTFTISQSDADTLADPLREPAGRGQRLRREISTAITEGAGGPYLRRLGNVRNRVTPATHIEIRGCEVGSNPGFLDDVRAYFGSPGRLPSISAPDIDQYFFQLAFRSYGAAPVEEQAIGADWRDPNIDLEQSFIDATRTRAGEFLRVVNDTTLANFARRYGQNADRLRKLNPQLTDPNALPPGEIIWLVARRLPAGTHTNPSDFCQAHLQNQYLWPTIWGYNPEIRNASQMQPNDQIWLVPADVRQRIATATPSFQDYRARLRASEAFVSIDAGANRPVARLEDRRRASAIATWLASQRFDPQGRTGQALSLLYTGGRFQTAMQNTFVQLLSRGYPQIVDPIFPDDPRYNAHIIHRP